MTWDRLVGKHGISHSFEFIQTRMWGGSSGFVGAGLARDKAGTISSYTALLFIASKPGSHRTISLLRVRLSTALHQLQNHISGRLRLNQKALRARVMRHLIAFDNGSRGIKVFDADAQSNSVRAFAGGLR